MLTSSLRSLKQFFLKFLVTDQRAKLLDLQQRHCDPRIRISKVRQRNCILKFDTCTPNKILLWPLWHQGALVALFQFYNILHIFHFILLEVESKESF
jgi:hypothetical protein